MFERASSRRLKWSSLPDELGEGCRDVEFCRRAKGAILVVKHHAKACPADACGILQHATEHRLERAG
jgi:hypothetical protein